MKKEKKQKKSKKSKKEKRSKRHKSSSNSDDDFTSDSDDSDRHRKRKESKSKRWIWLCGECKRIIFVIVLSVRIKRMIPFEFERSHVTAPHFTNKCHCLRTYIIKHIFVILPNTYIVCLHGKLRSKCYWHFEIVLTPLSGSYAYTAFATEQI